MLLVKNSRIASILKVHAIVLYPFVFFRDKNPDTILINHEMIHIAQIKKLGVFKFYFYYLKEYYSFRLQGKDHYEAYRSISFEVEAYDNQNNMNHERNQHIT